MNDARGNAVWRRGRADFSEIFFGLQETNERRFRDAVGGLHGHYERAIYPRSARVILPTSVNDRRTFAFGDRPRATRPAAPGAILARFAPGARNRRVAIRPASFAPAASACFGVSVVAVRRPAFAPRTSAASSFAMNFSLSPRSRGSDYSALASDGNEALLTRNEQARRTRSRRARASSPERRDRTLLEIRARRANDDPRPGRAADDSTPRPTPLPDLPRDPDPTDPARSRPTRWTTSPSTATPTRGSTTHPPRVRPRAERTTPSRGSFPSSLANPLDPQRVRVF